MSRGCGLSGARVCLGNHCAGRVIEPWWGLASAEDFPRADIPFLEFSCERSLGGGGWDQGRQRDQRRFQAPGSSAGRIGVTSTKGLPVMGP